ncbi:MAG: endolytic transglycosylase MltG [Clostridia bacterium]|nr:endolytic transglycosylase MltG [Clostridia bacterium]
MNEEKVTPSQKKKNTIDIMVSPKKKGEKNAEDSKKTTALRSTEKTERKKKDVGKEATRKLPLTTPVRTAKQRASETRVSDAVKASETAKNTAAPRKATTPKPKTKMEQRARHEKTPEEKRANRASLRSTVFTALIYIAVVVCISTILSVLGIRWANDVFALVKEEVAATVTIPENAQIQEVADILKDNSIIEYPSVFRMYIGFKYRDADPPLAFKAGDYELQSTLNYDQIVGKIKDRKTRSIVTLTIPEGFTVDEIIDFFTSQGIGTRDGFVDAINNFPYEYTFMEKLNQIPLSPDRRYRLEGYLFPDTYDFYTDSSEVAIVDKMLTAFESHFEEAYYLRLDELGMNLDQVVTLASIVQKEGKFNSDFYPISGVFHNRLKSKTLKRLQSDATVQYCLEERKEELTYGDLEVQNPYNTYRIEGLPPSAIANPGWEAIQAALYPESHGYYFFISDTDGSTIFAKSETEHLRNVDALRKAKEEGTTID